MSLRNRIRLSNRLNSKSNRQLSMINLPLRPLTLRLLRKLKPIQTKLLLMKANSLLQTNQDNQGLKESWKLKYHWLWTAQTTAFRLWAQLKLQRPWLPIKLRRLIRQQRQQWTKVKRLIWLLPATRPPQLWPTRHRSPLLNRRSRLSQFRNHRLNTLFHLPRTQPCPKFRTVNWLKRSKVLWNSWKIMNEIVLQTNPVCII